MKKIVSLILISLAILFLVFRIVRKNELDATVDGLNRNSTNIEYTRHATCRMQCRSITREEILDVLRNGKLNLKKSDRRDKPCPSYALEDVTDDGDRLRIVFAQCDNTVKVVTAIDLNKEHQCECP